MGRKTSRTESAKKGGSGLGVYEAVLGLNQGFEQVADDLDRLEGLGLFEGGNRRTLVQGLRLAVDETRNWINFEVAEVLNDRARSDWSRLGQLLQKWEDRQASVTRRRSKSQRSTPRGTTRSPE